MLEVVTRASKDQHHDARQHRSSQFEGESRLVGDDPAQQGGVAAVGLELVVLYEGVKHRCLCACAVIESHAAHPPGQLLWRLRPEFPQA